MHIKTKKFQYLNLFDEYYQSLPPKSRNQLKRGVEKPLDGFWANFVELNLFLNPDGSSPIDENRQLVYSGDSENAQISEILNGSVSPVRSERPSYIGLSDNIFREGRNHYAAEKAIISAVHPVGDRSDPRNTNTYFTNYLRRGDQQQDDDWTRPSKRVTLDRYTYFTIEHDAPQDWDQEQCIALLDKQLSWFRRKGSKKDSAPIFKILAWARQFADFRGIVACYSGHKSIHIVFVFDTSDLMERRPELRDGIRPVLIDCFHKISQAFVDGLPCGVEPDPQMGFPEQYRRLPNGVHVVNRKKKDGGIKPHIFDIPHGTSIPQVTIFEELTSKAPRGAKKYFIDELTVEQRIEGETASASKSRSRYSNNTTLHPSWLCAEERDYCVQKLADKTSDCTGGGEYPKLDNLDFETQLVARFLADENDTNPDVFMFENRSDFYAPGNRKPITWIDIGNSLGQWVLKWRREWRAANPGQIYDDAISEDDEIDVLLAQATDHQISKEEARSTLRTELDQRLDGYQTTMVHAPEGIGKTTALMKLLSEKVTHLIDEDLSALEDGATLNERAKIKNRPSMMAFSNYEMAEEKCGEFNKSTNTANCIGIVVISFSKAYELALSEENTACGTNETPITRKVAAHKGFTSKLSAIQKLQPSIWGRIRQIHTEMLESVRLARNQQHVVFFSVHDVLRQWADSGLSPVFCHKDFFDTHSDNYWRLAIETRLRFAVHDEVSTDHIVTLKPAPEVNWVRALQAADPEVWFDRRPKLDDAYGSWSAFAKSHVGDIGFEEALEIHGIGFKEIDRETVGAISSYGLSDDARYSSQPRQNRVFSMYQEVLDCEYYHKKHNWWDHVADKTILLTTEALPRTLFEIQTHGSESIAVYDGLHLSAPSSPVSVHRLNSVKAKNNDNVIQMTRDYINQPEIHAICNSTSAPNVTNYINALGSNKFIAENLLQVMNYTSPDEFATNQIINKIYNIKNAIQLHQVDLINQVIGRNLGYREPKDGLEHHLVLSYGLWDALWPTLKAHSRYSFTAVADAKNRRDQTHNQHKALMRRLVATQKEELEYFEELERSKIDDIDEYINKLIEENGYHGDE